MFFYPFNYLQRNTQAVSIAADKLKQRNLPIEQILDEDELMNDLKFSNNSQLVNHLTKEDILGMINYAIREPETDEHKPAYKYPFNATDILSGENSYLLDRFFEDSNQVEEEKYEDLDEETSKKEEEKIELEGDSEKKEIYEDIEDVTQKIQKLDINQEGETENENENEEETQKEVTGQSQDYTNEESNKLEDNTENYNANEKNAKIDNEEKDLVKIDSDQDLQEESKKGLEDAKEKVILPPKFEIFDYFLTFLDSDNELNYVLCGYFAKIFNSLKYNRPAAVTRYLYLTKREYFNRFVVHLNRKSIADTLLKMLVVNASDNVSDLSLETETSIKCEIILNMIESFNVEDEERCQNICDLLSEALSNRKLSIIIMKNESILTSLHNLLFKNVNSEFFKELLKVITKLGDTVLKELKFKLNKEMGGYNNEENYDKNFGEFDDMMPSKNAETLEIKECPNLIDTLYNGLEFLVKDYIEEDNSSWMVNMHTTYDKTIRPLGVRKLLEMEYIKTIFEILLLSTNNKLSDNEEEGLKENDDTNFLKNEVYNNFITKLIENNFFKKSLENFYTYEWNNSYQKLFEELMTIIISSNSDLLIDHMFTTLEFLDRAVDNCLLNRFEFNSGRFINCGYLSSLIEISFAINNTRCDRLNEIVSQHTKWNFFFIRFIEPIRKRFSGGLHYDLSQETNLFRDEISMMNSHNDEGSPKKHSNVPQFEERNFIEVVRRRANMAENNAYWDAENNEQSGASGLNEEFLDSNYWRSSFVINAQQLEEALMDLD